jgi:hypothetical protein
MNNLKQIRDKAIELIESESAYSNERKEKLRLIIETLIMHEEYNGDLK